MPRKREKFQDALGLLGVHNIRIAMDAYNPWWESGRFDLKIPDFTRDFFKDAWRHIESDNDLALLINGPRRIGKTTLMYQLIRCLVDQKKIPAKRILFFSLDDPVIQQLSPGEQGLLFESILHEWARVAGGSLRTGPDFFYCFLDEVQRLPRWELFIKRYVDTRHPIRFVISGSASHTIFRKSLESLLGRIVELPLPPFTFREFVRYHHAPHRQMLEGVARDLPVDLGDVSSLQRAVTVFASLLSHSGELDEWNHFADTYAQMGGFPQLWDVRDAAERSSFVDQQYVQRVTQDDLYLIREIRRPEIFHQFLRYAFARTGQEYDLEELAAVIHTTRVTLASALPLLLQTELIRKVERFTGKPVRLRSTHAKLYAADPVLAQAVNKVPTSLTGSEGGRIAETLVLNSVRRFPGVSEITYHRVRRGKVEKEIDFIARVGNRIIPVEVKYRKTIDGSSRSILHEFFQEHRQHAPYGILVTQNSCVMSPPILEIPLPIFLLLS